MALDDAQNSCQSKAGSFAGFFRRKEWLKNFVQDIARDARAGIGDFDQNVKAGLDRDVRVAGRIIERLNH